MAMTVGLQPGRRGQGGKPACPVGLNQVVLHAGTFAVLSCAPVFGSLPAHPHTHMKTPLRLLACAFILSLGSFAFAGETKESAKDCKDCQSCPKDCKCDKCKAEQAAKEKEAAKQPEKK